METEQGTQTNPEPPVDLTALTNQIKVVAKARAQAVALKESVKCSLEAWELANKEIITSAEQEREHVADTEERLRNLTIEAYNATGNKAPVPGVGIREIKKLAYDEKEALKWAKSHDLYLKLDDKKFKDYAKDGEIDFVTITTEITATIAKELEVTTQE